MPLKTLKRDAADALTLEWILHVKNYKLALDKNRCVGCQICSLACPKEAIKVEKQPKVAGENAKKAKVDIDLAKCNFCGICDASCPFGAVRVTFNGQHTLPILEKESFPSLQREIKVNTHNCPKDCVECADVCPLGLIKINRLTYEGQPVENLNSLSPSQRKLVEIGLDINKDYCPTCRVCEFSCGPGAIKVQKAIEGTITIDQSKCPEGCKDCLDVCPIKGTLYLSEKDNKVHTNEKTCVYCGACKAVCPVNDALTVKRSKIFHTPVHSGAWNKALERETSPTDAIKELKATGSRKAQQSVKKRFPAVEEVIR